MNNRHLKKSKQYDEAEDSVLYVMLARLMKPVEDTMAFQLGLINRKYKVLKEPVTIEEKRALSPLNLFVFQIKRSLGTRLVAMFRYMYLNNFDDTEVLNRLAIKGTIKSRTEVKKAIASVKRDAKKNLQ